MRSSLTIAAFVFMGLVSSVQPAQANIWDWMQEWSGPGPFQTAGNALATICTVPYDTKDQSVQNRHPCLFIDARSFRATDNDNFPVEVVANFIDAGLTWRVRRPVEVGVGAGMMMASGTRTAVRPTFTAPRITVKPVLLVAELFTSDSNLLFNADNQHLWSSRWFHVLKFYVRGNVIGGRLTGEDLGVSGSTYDRKFEYVLSRGFLIDLGELLPTFSGTK